MRRLWGFLLIAAASVSGWAASTFPPGYAPMDPGDFPAPEADLQRMRTEGDLTGERRHLWHVFAQLSRTARGSEDPIFMTWFGAGEVFAGTDPLENPLPRSLQQALSLPPPKKTLTSNAPPLIIRAHYNFSAYEHIRGNGLFARSRLTALGAAADSQPAAIPAFPRNSLVMKTVWWPVPKEGTVALPVWDGAGTAPGAKGSDYLSWPRVVAVSHQIVDSSRAPVELRGKSFADARRVGIDSFYHVVVDAPLALQMMNDPEALKAALMLLGRPLRADDSLILVAMHVATRETADWVWGTLWWHDSPDRGEFASGRPDELAGPWRHYLLNVSFDAELPREPDGSPHVAFNPWLEGRFPDQGAGSGLVSNCLSCHRRASTTASSPFTVTRGTEQLPGGAPFDAPGLTTSSLWSIPLEAR